MVEREGMRRGSGGGCGWGGGLLGRWSIRRLLLDSPLVGRRFAHSVLDQGQERQVKSNVDQSQSRQQTAVECIAEDEEGEVLECPLCLSMMNTSGMVRLAWCSHRCCEPCLRQYLAIEIFEARVPVNCPVCHENMHPSDVRRIVDNPVLYDKYEEFSVRRALAADPDTRWCPAPDCSFAVVAAGCASCPKLTCLAPGCGASFCYHCKAAWHPTQTCDAARRSRQPPPRAPQPSHADIDHGEVKPCPRCSVLIVKVEDGSCNHMVCCVCGAEFCWLCMKEVSDLHYLSPSGCTFWGKKPWSRKKKLLWQLGTLAGAPLGIAVVAGVALPALLVGLPLWAGRRAHRRLRRARAARRRLAVAAAVAAAVTAGVAAGGGAGGGYRRAHPAVLRVRRGAGVAVSRGRLRGWTRARRALRRRAGARGGARRGLQAARAQHRGRVAVGGLAAGGGPRAVAGGAGGLAGRPRGGLARRAPARGDGRRGGPGRLRLGQRGQLARRPALHLVPLRAPAQLVPVRVRGAPGPGGRPRGPAARPAAGPRAPHLRLRDGAALGRVVTTPRGPRSHIEDNCKPGRVMI